ncbi:hypothetical protein L7F22_051613 [Adiantum nelumboides]|nr:hypothetical protein [Adiantum nelumboides]
MKVASSLPNYLNAFQLRILVKDGLSTSHQEAFSMAHDEAAATSIADEEIEEGEIVTREVMLPESGKGAFGSLESAVLPFVAQHSYPNLDCIDNTIVSQYSAQRLPRLASVTDCMHLDHSVDSFLSLPVNVPHLGQNSSHASQVSYPSMLEELCQVLPSVKQAETGFAFVSSPLKSSPVETKSSVQASSSKNFHLQAPSNQQSSSDENVGRAQNSQPLDLQANEVQAVMPAENCGVDVRAFMSCANGKRRPRSFAIRDYPEGCGIEHRATTNQELNEPAFPGDKVPLLMTATKAPASRSLVSAAEQGKSKQKLIRHLQGKCSVRITSGSLQRLRSTRPEDRSALSCYKSRDASVCPSKTQTGQDSLPHKRENQPATDYPHGTAAKKLKKIRPLLQILGCTETSPHDSEEGFSHGQRFSEAELFGHDYSNQAVRPLMPHVRPILMEPTKKIVSSMSQYLKGFGNAQPFDTDCGASSRFQGISSNFSFRIEMLIVGLHRQVQGGIDYIAACVRPKGPLATSIVASGGYEDDDDFEATFIYTGQGGNNYKTDRRQGKDQVLKRGNLALSNSFKEKSPVRVIRGSTDDKFYTYDGLYDVIDCWFRIGVAGFGVYQFKLSRRPGQPELVSSIVKFMVIGKNKGLARPHLLLGDLSHGKERLPVSVVNEVDGEPAPECFTYTPVMKYPGWYHLELSRGCDCVGGCVDASKCLCAARNGGEFPYNEIGQIVRGKKVVFECGKSCACPSSCYNRVSQKGLKHQLEVFKTRKRGWGVRSLEPIRPGDFICEYAGELLSDADAERRTGRDEYLFDIGHRTNAWMDVSDLMDSSEVKAIVPVVEDGGFTIDARLFGSVARFINHNCSPNLYAQDVVYDSDDRRFPHVMLFAMENIPPMRELSYDYNYTVGHVRDANGDVKWKACYCESQDCRGRLY